MSVNELAVAAKNGDGKAFSVLLKRMEGAINKVVSRYAVGDGASYREEYIQEAICGLYNCLESYDEEKGAFVTYASYAMNVQILDRVKRSITVSEGHIESFPQCVKMGEMAVIIHQNDEAGALSGCKPAVATANKAIAQLPQKP